MRTRAADAAAVDALRAEVLARFQPDDPLTRHLAERAALLVWRLQRLAEAERQLLADMREPGERRFRGGEAVLRALFESSLARLADFEQRVARELCELLRRLAELCPKDPQGSDHLFDREGKSRVRQSRGKAEMDGDPARSGEMAEDGPRCAAIRGIASGRR